MSQRPSDQALDAVFFALSDGTRRDLLARLASGPATVQELCAPLPISQPAVSKHLRVLERAGLVQRSRDGRHRPAHLRAAPLADANAWIERYRDHWSRSFDRLESVLADLVQDASPTDPPE